MSEATDLAPLEALGSALGAAGYAAYSMTLVGHVAPMVDSYRQRVMDPQPGDLVMETSTFPMRSREGVGFVVVGTLVRSVVEHVVEPADSLQPDGWEYDEQAWYVDPIVGGETVRWTNAMFIAIPMTQAQAWEWQGRA